VPLDLLETGIRLRIRLTPNARQEGIGGIQHDSEGARWLKASVRAVPEDGKANAALVKMLAKQLGLAQSEICIVSGKTNRMKILQLPVHDGLADRIREMAG
jgi:uncharacterized protein (TIGR00251 family)